MSAKKLHYDLLALDILHPKKFQSYHWQQYSHCQTIKRKFAEIFADFILLIFLHWGGEHVGQFLEYCAPDVTAAGTSEILCLAYVCSGVKTLVFFLVLEGVDDMLVFTVVTVFSFMTDEAGNKPIF